MRARRRRARERGLAVIGSTTQGEALRALGYDAWQAQQRERQGTMRTDGDLKAFYIFADTATLDQGVDRFAQALAQSHP